MSDDDRITSILSSVGWPSDLYSIFAPGVIVTETVYAEGKGAAEFISEAVSEEFEG